MSSVPAMRTGGVRDQDTGCRNSVAMHNATVLQSVTTVSPNWNLIIVLCQAEAGFLSKNKVAPLLCPCPPFISPMAS
ncbi:hypothetical protein TNCV_3087641 [Trichonephila clavipes]|uniref:Uncharacterized protein n=1 Tax=Trichonephila clavipes TaxID=2585209 RepID=A0A8X6RH53_TRICX|nr:hypothetical protein TNCV_3087641 [Trichonephila clavipes]